MAIGDFVRKSGRLFKTLIVLAALVLFALLAFWMIQSGLAVIFIIVAAVIAFAIVAFLFYRAYMRYQFVDLMKEAWFKLFRSARLGSLPYEVPLIIKFDENATIESFQGMVQGRTLMPIDPKIAALLGVEKEAKRLAVNEENELEEISEDNILWCFRVKQSTFLGKKEVLYIIADSQISQLSRDKTGDIQVGTPVLAYGQLLQIGRFYVLWDTGKQLEKSITAVKTVAVISMLERYINRLGQLTRQDVKTRQELLEKIEVRKDEADVTSD